MLHTAWVCSIFQKEETEMQEQVKATFLVNAAVLLEFRGTKLLIDGIYDKNGRRARENLQGLSICCLPMSMGIIFRRRGWRNIWSTGSRRRFSCRETALLPCGRCRKRRRAWGFRVFCCIGNYAGKLFFVRSRRFVSAPSRPDIWISFTGMCRISAIY